MVFARLSISLFTALVFLLYDLYLIETQLTFRLSQIAAAEEDMRAKGQIDKNGHLTNGKDKQKAKKHDQ
jgi:hypothetical protein